MSADDINKRKLISNYPHISDLVNTAGIPSVMGSTYSLDANADLLVDQTIRIFRYNPNVSAVMPLDTVVVGSWSFETGLLKMSNDSTKFFFLGNATSPPLPPVIPTQKYQPNKGVRAAVNVLMGAICLFTVVILAEVVIHVNVKIIKAASPLFLAM
jgi:hypothetical protein